MNTPEEVTDKVEALKDAEIPKQRRRLLMIDPSAFMSFFTKGLVIRKGLKLISGIPDDAELLAVAADPIRHGIMLVVKSEEYDEVPINEMPPTQIVEIELLSKTATKKKAVPRKKRK